MSRRRALRLGILSLLPLVLGAVWLVALPFVWQLARDSGDSRRLLWVSLAVNAVIIFLILNLLAYFLRLTFKAQTVSPEARVPWIVALVAGGPFIFPLFWYVNIWRRHTYKTASTI